LRKSKKIYKNKEINILNFNSYKTNKNSKSKKVDSQKESKEKMDIKSNRINKNKKLMIKNHIIDNKNESENKKINTETNNLNISNSAQSCQLAAILSRQFLRIHQKQ
jgi:hypothetical protein